MLTCKEFPSLTTLRENIFPKFDINLVNYFVLEHEKNIAAPTALLKTQMPL